MILAEWFPENLISFVFGSRRKPKCPNFINFSLNFYMVYTKYWPKAHTAVNFFKKDVLLA